MRVAALRVEGEGCKAIFLGEEVAAVGFSCGILRERRVGTKVGMTMVGGGRGLSERTLFVE